MKRETHNSQFETPAKYSLKYLAYRQAGSAQTALRDFFIAFIHGIASMVFCGAGLTNGFQAKKRDKACRYEIFFEYLAFGITA